ncbi:hypothetical protein CspHIS471_0408010 [Cutaneotrichosporon sp. HIS471]|nr:hypothetical protein CspHIS471_0408010 [Cutaneotrichosporon sp. HIS471]
MQVLSRNRRMFSNPGPPPPPEPVLPENTNRILIAVRSQYKLRLRPDDHLFVAVSRLLNGELVRQRAIRRGDNAITVWDDKIVITTAGRMDVDFMLWAVSETEATYREGWRVTGVARDPSNGSLL